MWRLPKNWVLLGGALALLAVAAVTLARGGWLDQTTTLRLSGLTMGTTYNVVAVDVPEEMRARIEAAISNTLERVNAHLSNWDRDSEISRFNATRSTEPVGVSELLGGVLDTAGAVHSTSGGALDLTLAPLVELWGFGPGQREKAEPSQTTIATALASVGQARQVTFDRTRRMLSKAVDTVELDLSAVAKGAGIDELARVLETQGVRNYLVEIGGDLIASGASPRGAPWHIAIEQPVTTGREIETTVAVSGLGMATSGDYRNYFEKGGVRFSHILNPKTGRPIAHQTASVTVLADTAALADAWATALLVLGSEAGLEIAEANGLAALFIDKTTSSGTDHAGKSFTTIRSTGFDRARSDD